VGLLKKFGEQYFEQQKVCLQFGEGRQKCLTVCI